LELLNTKSDTKHIPRIYKLASRNDRLQLIAGLLDTDGSFANGVFDFITKSEQLAEDMSFVCSSVGLRVTTANKSVKGHEGIYKRLCISGDLTTIPTKLARKQAPKKLGRRQDNEHLTGFSLEEVPKSDFYGFTVDSI
jgi:hypothetical protein